jgi:hypothetical protein
MDGRAKGGAAMNKSILVVVLALSLVGVWGGPGVAGDIGYRIRSHTGGMAIKPRETPSSGVMTADALIGRPLGVACTALGTTIFIVTLPTSLSSNSLDHTFEALVKRPAGWTFVRPLGPEGLAPQYEERGLFGE